MLGEEDFYFGNKLRLRFLGGGKDVWKAFNCISLLPYPFHYLLFFLGNKGLSQFNGGINLRVEVLMYF